MLPERNLDLLRATAILMVVVSSVLNLMGDYGHLAVWLGQSGVSALLVHSALVLMASLERDGAPTRPGWVGRFYLRRAFRLYPLAWVVIAAVMLLHIPSSINARWEPESPIPLLMNLLLVQDLALKTPVLPMMWALPIAVQMCIVLPLCYVIARKPSRDPFVILFAVACALAMLWTYGVIPPHLVPGMKRLPILRFIPGLLMGVLAYRTLRLRTDGRARFPWWSWLIIIALNVALGTYTYFFAPTWVAITIFCAVLALTLPSIAEAPGGAVTRGAHILAAYSYSIYLLHELALRIGFDRFADQPVALKALISAVVLVVGCIIVHVVVEKPCIELGRKILGERGQKMFRREVAPPAA